ncbi:Cupin 2 conserved barrel domain protein [Desulfurispirillum indicum S5]|uniref:Cupin 2 conserved barrel domain protein n=1 Tax=Desulfurispirillum indicum (strain ATCC BAA-1389 / DSM 22839 / S5) TaxID=653733 RepID=E6W6N0_DESIS|nr:cupin domain-containing protein [Desulfurispirillum indicum]ADU65030.1 Cupin 2 conserved barrel domain protein [Desulfurispirillum indicum S5]
MSLIKNITHTEVHQLAGLVEYGEGKVVSRTLTQTPHVGLTLFAFDAGEGISTHSAPGDAMVQILDGSAEITIGETTVVVKTGEVVVMPADIPHGLKAKERFKMLLFFVSSPKK